MNCVPRVSHLKPGNIIPALKHIHSGDHTVNVMGQSRAGDLSTWVFTTVGTVQRHDITSGSHDEAEFRGALLSAGSSPALTNHTMIKNPAPRGLGGSDSDEVVQAAAYLQAWKPRQSFIGTHEYLMPSKTGLPVLPASPRRASMCV